MSVCVWVSVSMRAYVRVCVCVCSQAVFDVSVGMAGEEEGRGATHDLFLVLEDMAVIDSVMPNV